MFFKAIFIGRSESGRSCNNASLHAEYATFPKDTMAAGLMILNSSFKKGKLIPGYSEVKAKMSAQAYFQGVVSRRIKDPTLSMQMKVGSNRAPCWPTTSTIPFPTTTPSCWFLKQASASLAQPFRMLAGHVQSVMLAGGTRPPAPPAGKIAFFTDAPSRLS